ncbi:MAG: hypothetical protein ACRDQX_10005, partial [Pseudonocardiaceae bacterium]
LLDRGTVYAQLYLQQFGAGTVETRCANGVLMRSADIVSTRPGAHGESPPPPEGPSPEFP